MRTIDGVGRGLALAATVALAACGGAAEAGDPGTPGNGADADGGFARVINVEVAEIATQSFTEMIHLTGTIEANRDVSLSAEEAGQIREVFVEKGARLRSGQAIAKIDDGVLAAQVGQARAQAELARETWERRKRLYEDDQVGSEIAYLEARYSAEQAAANLAALEERLARTTIRAPFTGVLENRFVEVGAMVSPGTVVARILELQQVKVTAGVPERYAPDVRPGARAEVRFDVMPDQRFEAEIAFVGSAVDPQNRTFPVEFRLPNPDRLIKPEMVANVRVVRRTFDETIVVPQEALVRVEEGYVAFVATQRDGVEVAEVRPVTRGPSQENRVVVREGLSPGDRLVVVGQQLVEDGDRIRIVGG